MSSLFQELSDARLLRVPCALQSSAVAFDEKTGESRRVLAPGSKPLLFDLIAPSADDITSADAVLNEVKPPRLIREESRPGTIGLSKVDDGPDLTDPDYLVVQQKLLVKRNAYLCLAGCPMLLESTPGDTVEEKALKITSSISAVVLEWMAYQLDNMKMITAVGDTEVTHFLEQTSGDVKNSSGSKKRNRVGGNPKS